MQTHSFPIADVRPGPASLMASRLSRLSEWQFRTLLLAIGALAAAMIADGLQSFARLAEARAVRGVRAESVSPVPYRTLLPALHALAPVSEGEVRVFVRADAAGADGAALCALTRADVHWVALSADVAQCALHSARRAPEPVAAEIAAARWIVLDERGAALYSSRQVPTPDHLRAMVALLTPGSAKTAQ